MLRSVSAVAAFAALVGFSTSPSQLHGQQPVMAPASKARMTGSVRDSITGRGLSGAVLVLDESVRQTATDLDGHFAFVALPGGSHRLSVRRLGYEPISRDVFVPDSGSVHVELVLSPSAFQLAAVTVVPGAFSFLEQGPSVRQTITREQIQSAPFGEDLFRALNRLPGLSSGDYGASFSIRGGRHDETLIMLDGLEIYEPYHLKDFAEGALSVIDVEAIDGVELLTGGFPAKYGDKRSGVMNITSRTPKADGTRLTLGASLTNANALAEGTFADKRGSWLFSARSGYVDALLRLINKKETKAPTYQDLLGTVHYALTPNNALALNVLYAHDRYRFSINGTTGFRDTIPTREAANNQYGNGYVWATLRSQAGPHLTIRSLVSAGLVTQTRQGDEHQLNLPIELYGVKGHRNFSVYGLKQDFSFQGSERAILDWGYDLRRMHANFDWENRVTKDPDNPTPDTTGFYPRITRRTKVTDGTTAGLYASGRFQLAGPLAVETGLRYDAASYTHDRDWSPRLHALWRLSDRSMLRGGWGVYRQRQGIADENAFDKLNRYFPSELSKQWTLGFEHQYTGGGAFRVEAYTKSGSRLRPILRNWKGGLNVFPESAEDRILVYPDVSSSKGLELYHERRLGSRADLRIGYALAKVTEHVTRVDNVNDPLKLVFDSTHAWPQDQRHALNLDVSYRLSPTWSVTGALTYHTGWPYTHESGIPIVRRNGAADIAIRPDSLYGARLPSYQRLDVRFTRRRQTANGEWRFFFEVINLTNHENVLGYDVFSQRNQAGGFAVVRDPEAWFSILPSLGVSWSRRW